MYTRLLMICTLKPGSNCEQYTCSTMFWEMPSLKGPRSCEICCNSCSAAPGELTVWACSVDCTTSFLPSLYAKYGWAGHITHLTHGCCMNQADTHQERPGPHEVPCHYRLHNTVRATLRNKGMQPAEAATACRLFMQTVQADNNEMARLTIARTASPL